MGIKIKKKKSILFFMLMMFIGNIAGVNVQALENEELTTILEERNYDVEIYASDITPPVLDAKSISVDKKNATGGDTVKISLKASDDITGVNSVNMFYIKPITGENELISLYYDDESDSYIGKININDNSEEGIWKIKCIYLYDNAGNSKSIYDNRCSYGDERADLSGGDFTVSLKGNNIEPLNYSYTIKNEIWTNKVINGDLYVGPQSVLTINGAVKVTGNIYVFGAVKNYGNLTVNGTIYAKSFIWGNSTLYNGTVLMLGGSNNIASMETSNQVINVPLTIYESNNSNELVAFDGRLDITGAILPIVDLYVDGQKIDYSYNGTFELSLDVANKSKITIESVDVFENRNSEIYSIISKTYDVNDDGKIDILDIASVAQKYNSKLGTSGAYNKYDLNNDNIIDIFDLTIISRKVS